MLENPGHLDEALAPLGRAVASVLVRIGDLPFAFRSIGIPPPDRSSLDVSRRPLWFCFWKLAKLSFADDTFAPTHSL